MLCRVLYKNHVPSSSRRTYEADAMVVPRPSLRASRLAAPGGISVEGTSQPQETETQPCKIPEPAHSSHPQRHTFLWFYYYRHTMSLPQPGEA